MITRKQAVVGAVLLAIPLVVVVALWIINRDFESRLFQDGRWLVIAFAEFTNACYLLCAFSAFNKFLPPNTSERVLRSIFRIAIPVISLHFCLAAVATAIIIPAMVPLLDLISKMSE